MTSRVGPVFTEALKADRDALNTMFAQYRMSGHEIDADEFLDHLVTTIDPLVQQVNGVLPERVRMVVRELYGISLSLFGSSLLGSKAKVSEINDVFQRLLPVVPEHVAREPSRVAASLCNAAYNLASNRSANTKRWLDSVVEVATMCSDVESLLDSGKVLSWLAGMVQYRSDALQIARRLPSELTRQLLNLPRDVTAEQIGIVIAKLNSDPWIIAAEALMDQAEFPIRCLRKVGAFRGFNGFFQGPPQVSFTAVGLHVTDGNGNWDLLADAYGSLLHRTQPRKPTNPIAGTPTITKEGRVSWGGETADFPELANSTSHAFDGTTFAVTIPTSHHVYLLARAAQSC